jgi:hypothetical protein
VTPDLVLDSKSDHRNSPIIIVKAEADGQIEGDSADVSWSLDFAGELFEIYILQKHFPAKTMIPIGRGEGYPHVLRRNPDSAQLIRGLLLGDRQFIVGQKFRGETALASISKTRRGLRRCRRAHN